MTRAPYVLFHDARFPEHLPPEEEFLCCSCSQGLHSVFFFFLVLPAQWVLYSLAFFFTWCTKVRVLLPTPQGEAVDSLAVCEGVSVSQ